MEILVATGGAAHSTRALSFAARLAEQAQVPLTILTIIKYEDQEPEAESILIGAKALIQSIAPSVTVKGVTRIGHPAEEILAEIESSPYAVAVLGEKQHHGLITRFVIGSTAQRVVEHSQCPVILVKGTISGPIQRLLICDSGLPNDSVVDRLRQLFPLLFRVVKRSTVLHVIQDEMIPSDDEDVQIIDGDSVEGRLLHHDLGCLGDEGVECTPRIRHGNIVEEIVAEVTSKEYQLVVIGAHRGSGWRRILLDDIANRLILKLDCPMLVVR